ncbi:MAG: mechanosensitive ion channel family protein [Gammaproteobacteria bacterium]
MQEFNVILEPARAFLVEIASYLPRLAVAAVVLVGGWLLAKAARFAMVKALRALNFHVLTERAGVDNFLQQSGTQRDTTDLVGVIAYWLLVLAALIVAFNGLGLTDVTELLMRVLLFLPKVLLALLVVVFGAYFGRFVASSIVTYCRNVGIGDAELIGKVAQGAVIVFVILIAVDQLDIGGDLVQRTFLILLSGIVLALALAFGIGGRDWAAAILERWFPRQPPDRKE